MCIESKRHLQLSEVHIMMRCIYLLHAGLMLLVLSGCSGLGNTNAGTVARAPGASPSQVDSPHQFARPPSYALIESEAASKKISCGQWSTRPTDYGSFEGCSYRRGEVGASGFMQMFDHDRRPEAAKNAPFKVISVYFATDRKQVGGDNARDNQQPIFDSTRSPEITYGLVWVSIPRDHKIGNLESPSWRSLRFFKTPSEDVMVLRSVVMSSSTVFFDSLRARVNGGVKKSILVFVHGFNVSFEDAARRTAQMTYDLGFNGEAVFFSWPSQGQLMSYTLDEQAIVDAEPHLEQFLEAILRQSSAENIYLIAHSMGSRGLTKALASLAKKDPDNVKRIKEVVLAAPDIGAVEFTEQIAPDLLKLGAPITLYVSSNDKALAASKKLHGGARLGESGDNLVVLNGIETIDASNVDTDFIGHSYYGDRRGILADMWYMFNGDLRASQRCCLNSARSHGLRYWIFEK